MAKKKSPRLSEIAERIIACFAKEDIKDELFRQALVTNEIGDWAKFLTHDPKLNPDARPVGGRQEEILAAGQAAVMLFSLVLARGMDIEEVIEVGLRNWEDADWRKRAGQEFKSKNEIVGINACPGRVTGKAYVISKKNPIEKTVGGCILVASSASSELALYFQKAIGIVTDHGGKTSHAANIARAHNIPCLVGTGNATELIRHGSVVELRCDSAAKKGFVRITSLTS